VLFTDFLGDGQDEDHNCQGSTRDQDHDVNYDVAPVHHLAGPSYEIDRQDDGRHTQPAYDADGIVMLGDGH